MWNTGFDTIEELATASLEASQRKITAYYALGTFTDNYGPNDNGKDIWQRKVAQAVAFKTLALDVDCGVDKPYEDQRSGLRALVGFVKAAGLPVPMIVLSGNGLHCYWWFAESILKARWVATSTALKKLCRMHQFSIDESKVHDASMTLRPVGTTNFKGGNVVSVLKDQGPFDIEAIEKIANVAGTMSAGLRSKAHAKAASNALTEAALAGTEHPPSDPARIVANCLQIQQHTKDGGRATKYEPWFLTVGVAAFCIDPETVATEWSKGHADYSEKETRSKLTDWQGKTGPTTCATFNDRVPGICGKCTFFGKVPSPCSLGAPQPEPITITPGDVLTPSPISEPPSPFSRTQQGIFIDVGGVSTAICHYDFFPVQIMRDPANPFDETVWMWNKPHAGYTPIKVRSAFIFDDKGSDLIKCLSDSGIYIATKPKQTSMGGYMRAYIQKLQAENPSIELYDSFGWKRNYTAFVLGSTEYSKNSTGDVVATEVGISKTLINKGIDKALLPVGDFGVWRTCTKALAAPSMAGHAFALGTAFAAPLVPLTGLSGSMLALLGKSGEGKSTMLEWVQSVYGYYKSLGMTKESTQMSIAERMGMYGNLPMTIDEVTNMEPSRVGDLLYWTTQGQDKNRKTEAIAKTWATASIAATNRSLRDKVASIGGDTLAMAMRVFEVTLGHNQVFSDDSAIGKRVRLIIQNNYGHAARIYIPELIRLGPDALREMIQATELLMKTRWG
jgi:Superfamily II helicase and inactivated derivatives